VINSPSVVIGPFVQGEVPAPLLYQFRAEDGVALDLSGYDARFSCEERGGENVSKDGAVATITDAANGRVTYTWDGTEFPTAGRYQAELWVGNGLHRFASILLLFTVREPVASVPNV
jgi:hypothetical protein